jgi:hypothetical protein
METEDNDFEYDVVITRISKGLRKSMVFFDKLYLHEMQVYQQRVSGRMDVPKVISAINDHMKLDKIPGACVINTEIVKEPVKTIAQQT